MFSKGDLLILKQGEVEEAVHVDNYFDDEKKVLIKGFASTIKSGKVTIFFGGDVLVGEYIKNRKLIIIGNHESSIIHRSKRRYMRVIYPKRIKVKTEDGCESNGAIRDICEGGVGVVVTHYFPPGKIIYIDFGYGHVKSEVMWILNNGRIYRCGIKFVGGSEDDLNLIISRLKRVKEKKLFRPI